LLSRLAYWSNPTLYKISSYIKNINTRHTITALVGNSIQSTEVNIVGAKGQGFPNNSFQQISAASVRTSSQSQSKSTLASFFGRLNYSFDNKYFIEASLRADGSSKFPKENRWGTFPSGALAYRLSNEKFIEDLNLFSSLKVRVGYGLTGNDRVNPYQYLTTFSNYSTVLNGSGILQVGIEPSVLSNNDLKWESTAQFDLGLDMGFLKDRITASVDLYSKKTTDLLLNVPIGQWWGFNTQLINAGSMQNRGIELSVTTNNISSKDFSWSSTLNFAYNKQKCLDLAPGVSVISTNTANPSGVVSAREFTRLEPGKELGVIYGFKYIGVIKTGEKYNAQPNSKPGDPKYADLNGDGQITPDSDRTYLGNTNPHYIAGFTNNFHYKGFDLTVVAFARWGYTLNSSLYGGNFVNTYQGIYNNLKTDFWTPFNHQNEFPKPNSGSTNPLNRSVLSYFDGSFIKIRSISLGYNLPSSMIKKIGGRSLRVYAIATDPFILFSPYRKIGGIDPEGAGTVGIDTPPVWSMTFGLNLSF